MPTRTALVTFLATLAACATAPPAEPPPDADPAGRSRCGLDRVTIVALGME